MLSSNLGPFPAPRVVPLNVYQNESQAPVWEQAMFSVWLFALYVPLVEFSLIRYACMGCALGLLFWYHRDTFPVLRKAWPLFPYPILGLLSVSWSGYPDQAIRSGILQFLLPVFMVVVACRLRPSEFLRVMMFAGALGALYCVPYFPTLSEGGPYAQKNLLAYQMMIVTLISFATALNSRELPAIRLIGLAITPLAFIIQLNADSATSLVFAILGMGVLLAVKLFWEPVSTVAHLRSVLLLLIIGAIAALVLTLLSTPQNTFIADFLGLVGKDTTLTGRTGIWNAAELVSKEHPLFGVGLDGFWQPQTGLAETLNELNHVAPGSKISFHSAFWEVRVHLGLVGLGFFILTLVWAGIRTLGLWLRDGSVINSTFLIFYFIITVSCFTESYPSGSFSTIVAVLYIGAFASFDIGARKLIGRAHMVEERA